MKASCPAACAKDCEALGPKWIESIFIYKFEVSRGVISACMVDLAKLTKLFLGFDLSS